MESPPLFQSQTEQSGNDVLVTAGIRPAGYQSFSIADQQMQQNTIIIVKYLLNQEVQEFLRLADLRRKGWESSAGDNYFKKQRRNADKTDVNSERPHFKLMQRIGMELHKATHGFATRTCPGSILDMCAAPGGFLATAIRLNLDAEVVAFSLPPSDGGHHLLLAEEKQHLVKFLDITMLAADMGVEDIPEEHPDAAKFLPSQLKKTQLFELVLCDGHVLRTHAPLRASYRETREPARLKATQLALGLEHIKPGGTMIVLLHKIEQWDTVCLLRTFSKFSSIQLYKPTAGHAKRSSFYMIATNVNNTGPEAISAIKNWKAIWKAATFGTDEDYAGVVRDKEPRVEDVLQEFGPTLINHGKKIWATQADALAQAPFMKK